MALSASSWSLSGTPSHPSGAHVGACRAPPLTWRRAGGTVMMWPGLERLTVLRSLLMKTARFLFPLFSLGVGSHVLHSPFQMKQSRRVSRGRTVLQTSSQGSPGPPSSPLPSIYGWSFLHHWSPPCPGPVHHSPGITATSLAYFCPFQTILGASPVAQM